MDTPHVARPPTKPQVEIDISRDRRWLPFCLGIALGPSLFVGAIVLAFMHGSLSPVAILFTYLTLLDCLKGPETVAGVLFAVLGPCQYIFSGILLEVALRKNRFARAGICILLVHATVAGLCFALRLQRIPY